LEENPIRLPRKLLSEPNGYFKIYHAIGDLEEIPPKTDVKDDEMEKDLTNILDHPLNRYLNNSHKVFNHVRTETRDMALKRFEALNPGENFHNLDESLKTTYTDHTRTQNTIYRRLDYEEPADTVLNVRKSMWVHPQKNRAISIREAARLQSFQDSYKFCGSKDSQYQQIGNAVPPLFARVIAESLLESLGYDVKEKVKDIILFKEKVTVQ